MKSYEFEQLNWIDIELMKRVYAVRALRTVMRGLDITDPL